MCKRFLYVVAGMEACQRSGCGLSHSGSGRSLAGV